MGQEYSVLCIHCGIAMRLDESKLGERVTCPSCVETFTVPAFPDPEAGVEAIIDEAPAKAPEESRPREDELLESEREAAESEEREEAEISGQGTWTSIIIVALALVVLAGLLLFWNSRNDSIEVRVEDIIIVDRRVQRVSNDQIKWEVTIINSSQGTAKLVLQLEIYNRRGDEIHRDQMPEITVKPGRQRKLQRTSDYFSGTTGRAISRYEVVPLLQ